MFGVIEAGQGPGLAEEAPRCLFVGDVLGRYPPTSVSAISVGQFNEPTPPTALPPDSSGEHDVGSLSLDQLPGRPASVRRQAQSIPDLPPGASWTGLGV